MSPRHKNPYKIQDTGTRKFRGVADGKQGSALSLQFTTDSSNCRSPVIGRLTAATGWTCNDSDILVTGRPNGVYSDASGICVGVDGSLIAQRFRRVGYSGDASIDGNIDNIDRAPVVDWGPRWPPLPEWWYPIHHPDWSDFFDRWLNSSDWSDQPFPWPNILKKRPGLETDYPGIDFDKIDWGPFPQNLPDLHSGQYRFVISLPAEIEENEAFLLEIRAEEYWSKPWDGWMPAPDFDGRGVDWKAYLSAPGYELLRDKNTLKLSNGHTFYLKPQYIQSGDPEWNRGVWFGFVELSDATANDGTEMDTFEFVATYHETESGDASCDIGWDVPASCPAGLDDEYNVDVCGVTVTVSRPEGNTDCDWTWTEGGETGCGISIDQVYLELDPGNAWTIRVEQGDSGIPASWEYCDYKQTGGETPLGSYDYDTGTGGASCATTALVTKV